MPQLEQKLQARLVQKLIITPQLQQAIRLLQLSKLDLQEEISQELVENPALEEAGTTTEMPGTPSEAPAQESSDTREVTTGTEGDRKDDDFDYASYFRDLEDSYRPTSGTWEHRSADELPTMEKVLSSQGQLSDHLLWQLEMNFSGRRERMIGEAIIGNLDEKGYLEASIEELAGMAPEGQTWEPEVVEEVRRRVQAFDPVGVASYDLRECLMVQLEVTGLADTLAARIVRDHMDLLERKRLSELEKVLEVDPEELDAIVEVIRQLDPRPGEKYNPQATTYITPDVYVIKDGDDYRVLLNEDGLPRLRISPAYRKLLSQAKSETSDATTNSFVREKVKAAFRLIRSLEERQRTIYKVAESIVKFQRGFLDKGLDHIRPLVLRDVAEDIGMHESTVSRVVNHKYMHTPRGLFEMRFFFHSGLASHGGDAISSLTVKEKIKRLVAGEDPKRPLSDQAIAEALRTEGLKIARRTVAKYREELRIPSSTQRRSGR
ncbi:MAG: RNA polymerase factor sigma-54 [Acidobacteriota bacterium]|nr:RNA polymerase factor sigma-54 [Acidobacteriota bacterium]MDQ7086838.1 RNA polymerase factor sigma-54 [Acidobacteriota bacterium]